MAGVKPLLETIGALLPKGIKAWHASPHDFDKVDLSKIGSGQGAQSYGPGFYAAESPAVSGQGGEYWQEFSRRFRGPEAAAANTLNANKFDRDAAIAHMHRRIAENEQSLRSGLFKADNPKSVITDVERLGMQQMLDEDRQALKLLESGKPVGPRVYELNLKADPRSFLQWDEPLSAQPEIVGKLNKAGWDLPPKLHDLTYLRQKVAESGPDSWYADQLRSVEAIGQKTGAEFKPNTVEDMARLRDAGIPGVRYLDAKSRSLADYSAAQQKDLDEVIAQITKYRAEGNNLRAAELDATRARMERAMAQPRTYNYVVNNPDIIEIMRKLAIPGMLTGGAASVYQPQGQQ